MPDGWGPRTGDAWFRWVESELRSMRRHRHGGAVAGLAFGSTATVQYDEFGNPIYQTTGQTSTFATATKDVTPPPPPSKPTLTVRLGVVTLTWDGLADENQLMPSDLAIVQVHRSTTSDFYPADNTLVGVIQPGGGSLVMPDQAYNSVWYYRLVAVDRDGNMSAASAADSATTTPLVSTDIIGQVLDGANFMDGTIDTAALADGSVSGAKIAAGSITESHLSFTLENGTTVTFAPTAPATPAVGDLWYDTDNGNQLARWDGAQWVVATYGPAAIADNAITETKIATDAVTTPKIAANAVTAAEIAANTITAAEIAANAVTADEIAANTITSAEIAANTITANEIASNSLTADVIAANAIGADELAANAVVAGKIAANAVTAAEIAALSITADKIAANAVTTDKVEAGSITAEKLAATLVLAGLMASSLTGRRWEADQYGIRLYETDGSLLIHLPTDINTPAAFKGDIIARSFTSIDQFTMRGTVNEISRSAQLKLASGVTAPGSPPSINVYTDAVTITSPYGDASGYDPHMHGWVRDGSYYYTAQHDGVNGTYVRRYATSNFALDSGWSISLGNEYADGGITILGGYVYTLQRAQEGHDWYTHKYDVATGTWQTSWLVTSSLTNFADGYWQAIGNDGTDLLVAYRTTGASLNIKKFSTTGTPGTLITTNVSGWPWNVTSINYGNFDYGSARYVLTAENREDPTMNPLTVVLAYSGSGNVWNLQTNEQWPIPGQTQGMCWDATLGQFLSLNYSGPNINRWSGIVWTTESSVWWASNTWYDSVGTTHETTQGPRTAFNMRKRATLRITSPPIPPSSASGDDVTRPRFYLGRGATDPGNSAMWRQTEVADGAIIRELSSVTFSGSNPPTVNDFPGATPAQVQSADGTSIIMKGDGTGNFGSLAVTTSGTNLGTHVLRAASISTSSVSAATWTDIVWNSTTVVNEDSWTLDGTSKYWTCPKAGTYSVFLRIQTTGSPAPSITAKNEVELDAESTADGTIRTIGHFTGHDFAIAQLPAVRMSINDRITARIYFTTAYSIIDATAADSYLIVTRLG